MAEMKPSPRNETLWRIAQALNRTRGFLNPAPDTPLHGVEWFRPGNLLIGSAPEEVREWSYGNLPFSQKPLGDRLPQPKRGTWERMDTGERETQNRALTSLDAILAAPTEVAVRGGVAAGAPLAMGAVRVPGVPGAVASHTTSASVMDTYGRDIAEKGLFAPSLGLTYKNKSDYNGYNPHYVFKAGVIDRPLPDQAPSGIWNRDAYVWNPSRLGWQADPTGAGSVREQWADMRFFREEPNSTDANARRIWKDARLTQMAPDTSHTAAILASPSFRDLRDWEDSPYGLGALRAMRRELGVGESSFGNYEWEFRQMLERLGLARSDDPYSNSGSLHDPRLLDLLEVFPALTSLTQKNPSLVDWNQPASKLYQIARDAPSEMAEVKLYAPQVPAGPEQARIFLPTEDNSLRRRMEGLGYDVWNAPQLDRYTEALGETAEYGPRIDLLAPNFEGNMPRPREFDLRGQSMVAQPAWPAGIDKSLTALTGWKHPAYSPEHPSLWLDAVEWFQGDESMGTLAQHFGKLYDLSPSDVKALEAIWADAGKNTTAKAAAEIMQNQIMFWKTLDTPKK